MCTPDNAPLTIVSVLARMHLEDREASARDVADRLDGLMFGPTYRVNANGDLHRFRMAQSNNVDTLEWVRRLLEQRGFIVRELYVSTQPLEK